MSRYEGRSHLVENLLTLFLFAVMLIPLGVGVFSIIKHAIN